MGFLPNRSTMNNIYIIHEIYERYYVYNIELHNLFINYMQDFDSLNRATIPGGLKQFSVPNKLTNLVKITLQDTKLEVEINNDYTEQFEVRSGVKEGDPLTPILFRILIDVVTNKLEIRGNI